MGLFDVSMPLLYGEGKRGFIRLQEEILKHTNDHTLFAWTAGGLENIANDISFWAGLLATSPTDFEHSNIYLPADLPRHSIAPYSMTNMGLCIDLPVFQPKEEDWPGDKWIAILGCCSTIDIKNRDWDKFLGIYLQRDTTIELGTKQYHSISPIASRDVRRSPITIHVKDHSFSGPEGSKELLKVEWKSSIHNAGWATLYISQEDFYRHHSLKSQL
jgi:hypothetical protein